MKKLFTILGIILGVAAAAVIAVGIFSRIAKNNIDMTDSSKWIYITHDEFKVRLPENLKSTTKLYSSSLGSEQIACYKNDKIVFSVAKQAMSSDQLKNLNLKKYIQSITIDGEKLVPVEVNGGYYYKTKRNSSTAPEDADNIFQIEALFKGDDAVYSIAVNCNMIDRTKYKDSMIKWIESFSLR